MNKFFYHRGTEVRRRTALFFLSVSLCLCGYGELIKAELGKGEVWMGEGVPLYITLEAPGPFSGTASFDLPEIPGTFFIKQGSPTVGSKTIAGETVMTQRHEFRVYTHQSGSVEISPIRVRYEAKPDFLSDPEPYDGATTPVQFISKRPPGIQNGQIVLTVESMDISQTWDHLPEEGEGEAGMVVERRIMRRARNTTAMLFQPMETLAPAGVRVYPGAPLVSDKSERGAIVAERVDVMKYQFTRDGEFILPDLDVVWWDGDSLVKKTLPGKTFMIAAINVVQENSKRHWGLIGLVMCGGGILMFVAFRGVKHYCSIENYILRKQVITACKADDAKQAYDALMKYEPKLFHPQLRAEWHSLSKHLFSRGGSSWNGQQLLVAFKNEIKMRKSRVHAANPVLQPLNPTEM